MEKNYQVVFTERGKVEVLEVPMPTLGDDQILIKTLVSQISIGTELTNLEANVSSDSAWNKSIKFPCNPGYSNVGEIVAVGKNVDKSLIGRKVSSGAPHVKFAVSDRYKIIPDVVDNDEAVFASLAFVSMASIRISQIRPGETVAVFGAGVVGQLVARLAKIAGALKVFVFDTSDFRLEKVPKDKCYITANSGEANPSEFIKANNGGELADIVFEATSCGALIQTELTCVIKNGKLIITSSPKETSLVDFHFVSMRGITIIGAHNWSAHPRVATTFNRWTMQEDHMYYLNLLEKNVLTDIKTLVTHSANYKDAPSVYKALVEDRSKALGVHLRWED